MRTSTKLEQQLQNYAQHMTMMQQNAAQQTSLFEQQRIRMQYEIDCMHFEMNDLSRQMSGSSSMVGSVGNESSDRFPGRDDMQTV